MGNCSPKRSSNNNDTTTEEFTFKVHNVDAKLFKHSKGLIKITNDDMILEQNNLNPITWPLHGIRRYGWYQNIFLFESGRKCPTGEGLYAFKCKKAEQLNNTLHATLLRKEIGGVVRIDPITNTTNNNTVAQPQLNNRPSPIATVVHSGQNGNATNDEVFRDSNGAQYVNEITIIKLPKNSDTERIIDACFESSKSNKSKPAIELIYTTISKGPAEDSIHQSDVPSIDNHHTDKTQTFDYTVINNEKTTAIKGSQASRSEYLHWPVQK